MNKIWNSPKFDKDGMTKWSWRVTYRENFKMGRNVEIGSFSMIDAKEGVDLEDGVKIGFGCIILSYSSIDRKAGKVILKNNSKLGANSVVMPGVTIGKNAVVGALSFVNRDIPADEVWAGSPARFIKKV